MYLKIMSDESHLLDSDKTKFYTIMEIPKGHRVHFKQDDSYEGQEPHVLALVGKYAGLEHMFHAIPVSKEDDSMVVTLPGKAYVLSHTGDTISRSPDPRRREPEPSTKVAHVEVKPGDTLSAIALKYRLPMDELVHWNRLRDANQIEVGQRIWLGMPEFIYSRKGDTLEQIARWFGIHVERLSGLNPKLSHVNIRGSLHSASQTLSPGGFILLTERTEEKTQD